MSKLKIFGCFLSLFMMGSMAPAIESIDQLDEAIGTCIAHKLVPNRFLTPQFQATAKIETEKLPPNKERLVYFPSLSGTWYNEIHNTNESYREHISVYLHSYQEQDNQRVGLTYLENYQSLTDENVNNRPNIHVSLLLPEPIPYLKVYKETDQFDCQDDDFGQTHCSTKATHKLFLITVPGMKEEQTWVNSKTMKPTKFKSDIKAYYDCLSSIQLME